MPITANGVTYSDDQIKNYFSSNPTRDSIAQGAASLGLNADQISQAMNIAGYGVSRDDVTNWGNSNGYNFNGANGIIQKAQATPAITTNAPGQGAGMWLDGNWITQQQIKDFYAGGGDDVQWYQEHAKNKDLWQQHDFLNKARELAGPGTMQGENALRHYYEMYKKYVPGGAFQNDYEGFKRDRMSDPGSYGGITSGTYTGQGWLTGRDADFGGVLGPGGSLFTAQKGSSTNGYGALGNGTGWGGVNAGGGSSGGSGGAGVSGGSGGVATGGSGSAGSTSSGIISSAMSGSTQPGNWTVDSNQLVRDQFGNLIDPNSPLMQKARTQALERMGERGLINSSLATTAADSAMYDAALGIAKQDASTYADAAKTNAGAKTSWAIAQNNNATSMANNAASIAAQKELTQATQLYNNLANQTASATTIQTWGLNTISSIMASDLSADAKNAAIAQIKTWMSDSYSIQGDWHTSAAKAIDAIFGG